VGSRENSEIRREQTTSVEKPRSVPRYDGRMFPRNTWYPCAWSHEIGRGLMQRWICGDPIVFYRTAAGAPVALGDRCPHRRAPLSMGSLVGDRVQCGYHGLEIDATGRCVHIPGQDMIPEPARVHGYPIVDRHRFAWIWPGDPAQADPARIPDLFWNDHPDWAAPGGSLTIDAHWQLVLDNLMDLSHLTYLHGRTIGTPYVSVTPARTRLEGDRVHVDRWTIDRPAPPMFTKVADIAGNVDRWQLVEWIAPGNVVIQVGCAPTGTGAPEGDRSRGIDARSLNLVTPMTERRSLYLWSYCRNYKLADESVSRFLYDEVARTFLEDKAMIEAQQHLIDTDASGARTIDIKVDAGPTAVRRMIDRMLRREQGQTAAA
jgi:phenylpropionate dioxygenase-like ring-hydroxylating dioxygenase large terminal subunit